MTNRPYYPAGIPAAAERGIHPQLHSTAKKVDSLWHQIFISNSTTPEERLKLLPQWEQAKADLDLFARQSGYGNGN